MNKLIVALGFTTVALAGSTAYLARELGVERERRAALEKGATTNERSATPATRMALPQPVVASTPAAAPAGAGATAASAASPASNPRYANPYDSKVVRDALVRDQLAQFVDPARRATIAARFRADLRRQLDGVGAKIGLTAEEEARLLDLMVEQQLRAGETFARCDADPSCDRKALAQVQEGLNQERIALLGRDRYERLATFIGGYADRSQVRELRVRLLDDETLSDAQADKLSTLLSEERHRFVEEAKQRGDQIGGFGMEAGVIATATPRDAPNRAALTLASGEEFNRRLHDRASEVLSSRQMQTYEHMQEELLTYLREQARREEVIQSAQSAEKPH